MASANLWPSGGERGRHGVEIVDQLLDDWLLSASPLENDAVLRQQRVQRPALALKDLQQSVGQCVDILRIQALDDRLETAQ